MPKTIHQGHNVKRFREMLGIKQEVLASELGNDWNQKKVSLLEQKEEIDPKLMQEIADALKVPAKAIANFDEEKAIYNIQNNYENSNNQGSNNGINNYRCEINPIEKWAEAMDEIKKLYEELLKSERQKNTLLERMLNERAR